MKVKMINIYAGPSGTHAAGDVAVFSDAEAQALIEGRHAEAYVEPVETAALAGGSVSKGKGAEKSALTPAQENRIAAASAKKASKATKAERAERA